MPATRKTTAKSSRSRSRRIPISELAEQTRLTTSVEHYGGDWRDVCRLIQLQGTRKFWREFWIITARTLRHRDELLKPLLADLETNLPWLVENYTSDKVDYKAIMRRVQSRIDQYDGPPKLEAFIKWAVPEVASTLKALHIVRKVEAENRIAFAEVYGKTYRAAWAGVLEVLKGCHHLGATHEVAEELVHLTMVKILCDIECWYDDGEASLATRVHAYAESQALGWRQSRIREKQRRGRLLGTC